MTTRWSETVRRLSGSAIALPITKKKHLFALIDAGKTLEIKDERQQSITGYFILEIFYRQEERISDFGSATNDADIGEIHNLSFIFGVDNSTGRKLDVSAKAISAR